MTVMLKTYSSSASIDARGELASKARDLIHRALANYDEQYGCGSMSCAIYDTAWVSMVTKHVTGERQWLFQESFRYLLETQSNDGDWGASSPSQIDGILNTAAALLSLQKHSKEKLQMQDLDHDDLCMRIDLASSSLARQLKAWNVADTRHVGFEVIVPALLDLLENENQSFCYPFDGREALMKVNAAKLARFKPELLYQYKTTAIHSLEAFIGKINFDKVQHHLVNGSMMGSPSSTAAYLMHVSRWDNEAEAFLRNVIGSASGQGSGGVPSAYPSFYFEHTWVSKANISRDDDDFPLIGWQILTTLRRGGFSASDLQSNDLTTMSDILIKALKGGNGSIGFAPGFESDVDDTAKGILSLSMLGSPSSAENMLKAFEAENHFLTYPGERDPSFSANCNVLLALLHQSDVSRYSTQILKVVRFLCTYWWDSDACVKDKWNLCHLYPCLLLVEAFVDLLISIQDGSLSIDLLPLDLQWRASITVFQACSRALLEQQNDGSWMESIESTAYGVLILCEARNLCFFDDLRLEVVDAIHRGISFLKSATPEPRSRGLIWVEKVSYESPLITEAYVLAAQKAASSDSHIPVGAATQSSMTMESATMARYVQLFRQTPLYSTLPEWQLRLSLLEATLFIPLLRARRLEVFPRENMEKDKYFEIIPFTWTSCNNRTCTFASTSFLYDMMVISFLNYQADEYMEAVAGPAFRGNLDGLRHLIDDLFAAKGVGEAAKANGFRTADERLKSHDVTKDHDNLGLGITFPGNGKSTGGDEPVPEDMPVIDTDTHINRSIGIPLRRFVSHVLNHPSIANASSWDRTTLTRELRTFLLAHVSQTEDNHRFSQDKDRTTGRVYTSAHSSFFQWVRTISANHTSCPYSFAFVASLLGASLAPGNDCFLSVREKYFAEAACRHLATMCRMYNDYGSVARDSAEWNLNSINFPEFNRVGEWDVDKDEAKKAALFTIADYERSCLDRTLCRLEMETQAVGMTSQAAELKNRKMVIWRMFCDVTDLYGQIYVVRDIASRMVP